MLNETVMKPRTIGAALLLVSGLGAYVACIPHPKEDYDDFLARTEDARAPIPKEDSGPVDSSAPTDTIEGVYFGSCLSSLSLGDLNKVLRFYTVIKYVPGPAGSNGALDIAFTPLKGVNLSGGNPVPEPPSSVSKGQTFGDTFGTTGSSVSQSGKFRVLFKRVLLDPNTNPISGRPIEIEDVTFEGLISASAAPVVDAGPGVDASDAGTDPDADPDATVADAAPPPPADAGGDKRPRFCAALGGYVVSPIKQPLNPETDFCVFIPAVEGGPVPEIKREEYKCALPAN